MTLGVPAAALAALFLVAFALFYAALALGAPWGAYAWGNEAEGPLPPRLRQGSAFLAPVCGAMAVVMLIRAGWMFPEWTAEMVWPVWGVFCFLVTTMFGSLRSPSRPERRVAGPILAIGVVLVGLVAFGKG